MDRHDVSEHVTAEMVAQLHQQDLKIQHEYDCRGLTYWFDDQRKTAFCLIEAPDASRIKEMHDDAHGEVPHRIIEVDANIVESFLGRIEDPVKARDTELNIINDPAFRTLMVIKIGFLRFTPQNTKKQIENGLFLEQEIAQCVQLGEGRVVTSKPDFVLASFTAVAKAVTCALKVLEKLVDHQDSNDFVISLSSGIPVTESKELFADTITLANRMCYVNGAKIIITNEVKELYKSENRNSFANGSNIRVLSNDEEIFLTRFFNYLEKVWDNSDIRISDFCNNLGVSKSQLYRNMTDVLNFSPNNFLQHYRLLKAHEMLLRKKGTISEVSFQAGFSSPSYFSKCFTRQFGIAPSELVNSNN